MKTKIYSIICAVFLILGIVFILSSCNSNTAAGIVSASINENGELILVYQNGTEQNLGVVVGNDGKDGIDGKDGKDGIDGKDGKDGIDGKDGKDGVDGKDGKDGVDGADGSDGSTIIIDNANGLDSTLAIAKGLRSVVHIRCDFTVTVQSSGSRPGMGGGTKTEEYTSTGSGVIYQMDQSSGSAFIITNYHVVYDSDSDTANGISDNINIYLYGSEVTERAIPATYVGGSLYYDIAVLYVENSNILKSSDACGADIADSNEVVVGESVIAIGNSKGFGISATTGIISVDSEYINMTAADGKTSVSFRVMRMDASVNSGNSGGGLFDTNGNLIGIVNAKFIETGVEGIGYAIPTSVAISVADNIIDYCYGTELEQLQRAVLGITVMLTDTKAVYDSETGKISIKETVGVYTIADDSLVKDELQENDVIVSAGINGKMIEITRQHHLIDLILEARIGDTMTFNVLREGELIGIDVLITEDCMVAY